LDDVGHRCECGSFCRCVERKDVKFELCGSNGMYGSPETQSLSKQGATQDEVRLCDKSDGGDHPWHRLDYNDDLMSQF
jgi:hypothetical protein